MGFSIFLAGSCCSLSKRGFWELDVNILVKAVRSRPGGPGGPSSGWQLPSAWEGAMEDFNDFLMEMSPWGLVAVDVSRYSCGTREVPDDNS